MGRKATVEGEVVLRDGAQHELRPYEEEIILNDEVRTIGQARVVIQGGLINELLRRKFSNFMRVRTCQVIDLIEVVEKSNNTHMENLMLEAAKMRCVPENIDNYKRPDYKAKALEKAIKRERQRKEAKQQAKSNVQDMGYVG